MGSTNDTSPFIARRGNLQLGNEQATREGVYDDWKD